MFVFGIILSLPGTVVGLPEAAAQFELTLADRGALISTLFIGLLIGSALSGPIVDTLGQRGSLAASAALVAIGLPLFALASSFLAAASALAALGVACAGVNTAANALSSDLFPSERGRRMNIIALMVGLGGLALPLATAVAAAFISWRVIVFGGGALAALVAVWGTAVRAPARIVQHQGWGGMRAVLGERGIAWSCAMVLLAAGTEASMAGWISTYLGANGFSAAAATWILSSHWLGLVVARIVFAGRVDRNPAGAVRWAALSGSLAIAGFSMVPTTAVLAAGPFVIGMAIAVVMPTSLALAGERYRVNAGALFGILLTIAQLGGIIMPALVGVVAESVGLRAGVSRAAANGVLIVVAMQRARAARP